MRCEATQNWTSTALGSRLVFQTTPNSTASPVDVMWVGQDASLLVKGAIGYQTGIGTGGAVTQVTSRTTGVTLNKPTHNRKTKPLTIRNTVFAGRTTEIRLANAQQFQDCSWRSDRDLPPLDHQGQVVSRKKR